MAFAEPSLRKSRLSVRQQDLSAQRALAKHHPNLLEPKRRQKIAAAMKKNRTITPVGPVVPSEVPFAVPTTRTASDIFRIVCHVAGTSPEHAVVKSRKRVVMELRQRAYWIIRKHKPSLSLSIIGNIFQKDHSTVLHGIRKIETNFDQHAEFIAAVEAQL